MATKLFTIDGEARWAKVFTPDEYNGVEKYKINIIPATPKDWNTIKESGLRVSVKKDNDGKEYITLSRPKIGKKNDDGEEFGGGQPLVLGPDKEAFTKLIGNGSQVEVLFATYDTRMGKGHRLETVMVKEHIPYEPMDGEEDTQGLSWSDRPGAKAAEAPVPAATAPVNTAPVQTVPVEPKMPF